MSIGGLGALVRYFRRVVKGTVERLRLHHAGLDFDALSDDQKRDMGFSDGRRPYREDPLG